MEAINFKPIGTQVIIKLKPVENMTESGIIIPDSIKDAPLTGTIVAVGPGTKNHPMETNVGDIVMFGQYSGFDVEIEGEKYIKQIEQNVLGILGREE